MGDPVAAIDAAAQAALAYRRQGLRGSALGCSTRASAMAEQCRVSTPALRKAAEPLPLTDREREVVNLIVHGLPNREIAERLTLSPRTVESYIYRAMVKTGTSSREELAALLPEPARGSTTHRSGRDCRSALLRLSHRTRATIRTRGTRPECGGHRSARTRWRKTMGTAKYIGRVGALAAALGVGNVRRNATRMTVVHRRRGLVVTATVVVAPSSESPAVKLSADSTALIVCGTSCPTPDAYWVEASRTVLHCTDSSGPGHRLCRGDHAPGVLAYHRARCASSGPPSGIRESGDLVAQVWPDEPWWKLSGLFDLTIDQSIQPAWQNSRRRWLSTATTIW